MNNKGQTTVFFSLIISILFVFTLTALEAGRIYMGRVKVRAVVHSTCLNIMADYNSALFERYHLLFMDPTYGTGSEAMVEEKIKDYMEYSLCTGEGGGRYQFTVEEIAAVSQKNIMDDSMQQLKDQITEYEKTAGLIDAAAEVYKKINGEDTGVEQAAGETERNGVPLPIEEEQEGEESEVEVTDPRDTLKQALKGGILAFVLPQGSNLSTETYDFGNSLSGQYAQKKDNSFQDIDDFKGILRDSAKQQDYSVLETHGALVNYVCTHFSNGADQREDSVIKCEAEYIIAGKNSDYDNLQTVVEELTWLRMPVNYAYLLTDGQKKGEALTLAAAICTATGTEAFIEVVKYLLLGCWAYGETLYEMRLLLSGEEIAYLKTKETWNTDLETLGASGGKKEIQKGMDYKDYLMLLIAGKGSGKLDSCYVRMLEVIEKNIQKEDSEFSISNCVGGMTIQGKVSLNPLFTRTGNAGAYEIYIEEDFSYSQ